MKVGPRIETEDGSDTPRFTGLEVTVANHGRGAVEVVAIDVVVTNELRRHRRKTVFRRAVSTKREERRYVDKHHFDTKAKQKFEIAGGAERQWYIDHRKVPLEANAHIFPGFWYKGRMSRKLLEPRVLVDVHLGNGRIRSGRLAQEQFETALIRDLGRWPDENYIGPWTVRDPARPTMD